MQGDVLDAWHEYVAQRAKDKKAMTLRSMLARVKRLQELKDAGHDPLHCLDEAINGHWLDFYEPKDKTISCLASSQAEKTRRMLDEQAARATSGPSPEVLDRMAELRKHLRRVA